MFEVTERCVDPPDLHGFTNRKVNVAVGDLTSPDTSCHLCPFTEESCVSVEPKGSWLKAQ